jgi:hypothetical protein
MQAHYPISIIKAAEHLPYFAGRLDGSLPHHTLRRIRSLLQITNACYTNTVDGRYTSPAAVDRDAKDKRATGLPCEAVAHIYTQRAAERLIDISRSKLTWKDLVSPQMALRVHARLCARTRGAGQSALAGEEVEIDLPQHLAELRPSLEQRNHLGQPSDTDMKSLVDMQADYGSSPGQLMRIIDVMVYHRRLASVELLTSGSGQVARLMTHLQLHYLGVSAPLWSLPRGLYCRHEEYARLLSGTDNSGQYTRGTGGESHQSGLFPFIEFMLGTCLEQMQVMDVLLSRKHLRRRILHAFSSPEMCTAGIKPACARAFHTLFLLGEISRSDFALFTGLKAHLAAEQVAKMIRIGLLEVPGQTPDHLQPGLPLWLGEILFPELHHPLQPA